MPIQYPPHLAGRAKLSKEIYAEALKQAELELRTAQAALATDDSNQNRERYARAVYDHDQLQAMFPFVAAGMAEDKV